MIKPVKPLPNTLRNRMEDQVATQGYDNVVGYVRGLLSDTPSQEQIDRLQGMLQQALAAKRAVREAVADPEPPNRARR